MTVEIQNTSSSKSMMKLLLVFKYDVNLYSFSRPIIKVSSKNGGDGMRGIFLGSLSRAFSTLFF